MYAHAGYAVNVSNLVGGTSVGRLGPPHWPGVVDLLAANVQEAVGPPHQMEQLMGRRGSARVVSTTIKKISHQETQGEPPGSSDVGCEPIFFDHFFW